MILIKNRLNAGFFSNLNAAMGWYWISMRTGIPVHVKWDGIPNKNIFDDVFIQKYEYSAPTYENNANFQHSPLFTEEIKEAFKEDIDAELVSKYDGWFFCQGKIYTDPMFDKIRKLYNYVYIENLKLNPSLELQNIKIHENTLGVNYRYIEYYFTNDGKMTPFKEIMSLDEYHKNYLTDIESEFENGKYDKIYVASSQKMFFDICCKKFKDKLTYLPMNRVDEGVLGELYRGVPLIKEFSDVLSDAINLSKCKHLIVAPNNITFAVLYMNPTITYKVINFLKETYTG